MSTRREPPTTVYREPAPKRRAASLGRWGDRALLVATLAVGLLPFIGLWVGQPAKSWELGLGALAILAAGASLVMDFIPKRRG